MTQVPTHPGASARPSRQRGVVLLFSLIALVVLMLAAVALMRSFNTSQFMAGNIAFKRDLQNQGERAVDLVLTQFRAGNALATMATRAANRPASNYSASMLAANAQGIPTVLGDSNFSTTWTAPDIGAANGVSIRYIVDRLCNAAGDEQTLGATGCTLSTNTSVNGGSASNLIGPDGKPLCGTCKSAKPQGVVYRLSMRVDGPRNTQAFFQSTFTIPSL